MTKDNPIETLKELRDALESDKTPYGRGIYRNKHGCEAAFIIRQALSAFLDLLEPIEGLEELLRCVPEEDEDSPIIEAAERYHKLCGGA